MLALTQAPAPLATSVIVLRHDAVALQAGATRPGGQVTHSSAALVAYVPGGQGAQAPTPPVAYVLAPHGTGSPAPPAQYAPEGHAVHAEYGAPLYARL